MTRLSALLVAAGVLILDRITKIWIERNLTSWDSISVIPGFFDLVHTKNRGAAFGIFSDGDSQVRTLMLIGVSLAVLLFIAFLLFRKSGRISSHWVADLGLALVLGGAAGNLYDRVTAGMVTDFLEFYFRDWRFAAFNVADSAISVGAGLLLLDMLRPKSPAVRT